MPPPKTLVAIAGKSARGMPNTMALTSIRYTPWSAWRVRRKPSPSRMDFNGGRLPAPSAGGIGAKRAEVMSATRKDTASSP